MLSMILCHIQMNTDIARESGSSTAYGIRWGNRQRSVDYPKSVIIPIKAESYVAVPEYRYYRFRVYAETNVYELILDHSFPFELCRRLES